MQTIEKKIESDIEAHPIILFMKGSRLMPLCGFSGQVVEILNSLGVSFETRNVLEDDELRQAIKEYSNWPTIPQLYINGEFIGGCDIVRELYKEGTLAEMVAKADG